MKKETASRTDIDALIRDVLEANDAAAIESYSADPSIYQMIGDTFRGRLRWLVWLTFVALLVYSVLTVVCAYQLFHAEEPREMLLWFGGLMVCVIAVGLLKIWYWMEMSRRSTLREIKRVELQVARLAAAISSEGK